MPLYIAHRFVAEASDQAAEKARQSRRRRGFEARMAGGDVLQRIGVLGLVDQLAAAIFSTVFAFAVSAKYAPAKEITVFAA